MNKQHLIALTVIGFSRFALCEAAGVDPCETSLPSNCTADVDGDSLVAVSDLLAVIDSWGVCGDGTFRPVGDVAPLPNGDCCVTVEDILAVINSWSESCIVGDECVSAVEAFEGTNSFSTTNMTPSQPNPDETTCILNWSNSPDFWFSFTAPTTAQFHFTTCDPSGFDTSMVLYEGSCDNQVTCNGEGNDDNGCQSYYSSFDYNCTAGTTYYIRIGGWGGKVGSGTLTIDHLEFGACCFPNSFCLDELTQPLCDAYDGSFAGEGTTCVKDLCYFPGDECEDAGEVKLGYQFFDTSHLTPSTPYPDESQCKGTYLEWNNSPDVWFSFTAPTTAQFHFTTCDPSGFDTSMVLYEGSCDNQVTCNGDGTSDSGCQYYYSSIDYNCTAGTIYYIRIGGFSGTTGAGFLTIETSPVGACCMPDGSCAITSSLDCDSTGGFWEGSEMCEDCPNLWQGCPAGATPDCDACWMDGDDYFTDCNGGVAVPSPVYQSISLGEAICGESSVFVDGPTGGTYRDLDFYTNYYLNEGGDFTISVGSQSIDLLFGVVDNAAGAFVNGNGYVLTGGLEGTAVELGLPAGDYSIVCGAADWNVDWNCANGNVEYWMQLD